MGQPMSTLLLPHERARRDARAHARCWHKGQGRADFARRAHGGAEAAKPESWRERASKCGHRRCGEYARAGCRWGPCGALRDLRAQTRHETQSENDNIARGLAAFPVVGRAHVPFAFAPHTIVSADCWALRTGDSVADESSSSSAPPPPPTRRGSAAAPPPPPPGTRMNKFDKLSPLHADTTQHTWHGAQGPEGWRRWPYHQRRRRGQATPRTRPRRLTRGRRPSSPALR